MKLSVDDVMIQLHALLVSLFYGCGWLDSRSGHLYIRCLLYESGRPCFNCRSSRMISSDFLQSQQANADAVS